jgi:hypothetical protein
LGVRYPDEEAAAALSGEHGEGTTSGPRGKTDMNALIREAANSREGPPGADMNAILRSAAGRTPARDKESEENEG